MRKNLIDVLIFLINENKHVSGQLLADVFKVSKRTIQNYVREINLLGNDIISSSNKGYKITDIGKANELIELHKNKKMIPQNNEERANHIIKSILISKRGNLKVYDLVDQLFISYSTLSNSLKTANEYLSHYNLEVIHSNNRVYIRGDESSKRKLMSEIIFEETKKSILIEEDMQDYFDHTIIQTSNQILNELISNFNYSINSYLFDQFLLHISIILSRSQQVHSVISKRAYVLSANDKKVINLASNIIYRNMKVELSDEDKKELIVLIKTRLNDQDYLKENSILDLMEKEKLELTNSICLDIKRIYNIDLQNDYFIVPFTLHVQNLIERVILDEQLYNSSTESIKYTYPLIYDIATHAASIIQRELSIKINQNEIAFLALHIGAELERQGPIVKLIQTVLILPDYLDLTETLIDNINEEFGSELEIVKILPRLREKDIPNNTQFIISFMESDFSTLKNRNIRIINIPTFNFSKNKYRIFEVISELQKLQNLIILKEKFDYFFNDAIFSLNDNYENKNEAISFACDVLYSNNYVNENFLQKVLEREDMSSTAFQNVAVPHQFIESSYKTGIFVNICKKPIRWDEYLVNFVFIVSIKKEDKPLFKQLYEGLLEIFTCKESSDQFIEIDTFLEFRTVLFNYIDSFLY